MGDRERDDILLLKLAEIQAEGLMPFGRGCVKTLGNYEEVIRLMRGFFGQLQANHRKDTPFPRRELRQRLVQAGVLSE